MRPFLKDTDSDDDLRTKAFVVKLWVYSLFAIAVVTFLRHVVPSTFSDDTDVGWIIADAVAACSFVGILLCLLCLYRWGLTRCLKFFFIVISFAAVTFLGIADSRGTWHFLYVLILDFCLVVQSEEDSVLLSRLSIFLRAAVVVYVALHVLSVGGLGPSIHLFEYEYTPVTQFLCGVMPTLLNFTAFRSYTMSAQRDARQMKEAVTAASVIAQRLAHFDLDAADELLAKDENPSPMNEFLSELCRNLRSYQPFLPHALWMSEHRSEVDLERDPPNDTIAQAMAGKTTSWNHVKSAVSRLRDPHYSLKHFSVDVEAAFPELQLYKLGARASAIAWRRCSSGLTGSEEFQRTMGAMYSVYCISRLDMDGKEIFSFGVDEDWKPRAAATGELADKRHNFHRSMKWEDLLQLFLRAGLLITDTSRKIEVNMDRMAAFLVLTAVHDIMKNTILLPTVHKQHAPYAGIAEGSVIYDHDVALAYVMEHFPDLLPSYYGLETGQRLPILFTQGKMGFNNGWLVQGEAPPGALFSAFKKVVVQGRASESDISFYFAHWLTDLAGAEPFDKAWPGSDKFVIKFPLHVLIAFLNSFQFVDHLANRSEVEVMEEYLRSRWTALGPPAENVEQGCELAAMRLALMAQGFEAQAVAALHSLPSAERSVIAEEMARTGLRLQFQGAPASLLAKQTGPALLVYYAPALVQKAGPDHVTEALQVLAAVYRAARKLFPFDSDRQAVERTVTIRIDALKILTPPEIRNAGQWRLRQISESDAEAVKVDLDDPCCSEREREVSMDLQVDDMKECPSPKTPVEDMVEYDAQLSRMTPWKINSSQFNSQSHFTSQSPFTSQSQFTSQISHTSFRQQISL